MMMMMMMMMMYDFLCKTYRYAFNFVSLKCSHTTAYDISVCQRMTIRSYTQIYGRGTLGIRRVRSSYAGIRQCTLLYAEAKIIFWTCSKIFSVCERIDYTLLIR